MKNLNYIQAKNVSGAVAVMSGGFSFGPGGMTCQNGFYIMVTDNSANVFGNFAAYPNKVINLATNDVLFDGTQNSFCINSNSFSVEPVSGGHKYKYAGKC